MKFHKRCYGLKILFPELQPVLFIISKILKHKNWLFYQIGLNQKKHLLENGDLIKVIWGIESDKLTFLFKSDMFFRSLYFSLICVTITTSCVLVLYFTMPNLHEKQLPLKVNDIYHVIFIKSIKS